MTEPRPGDQETFTLVAIILEITKRAKAKTFLQNITFLHFIISVSSNGFRKNGALFHLSSRKQNLSSVSGCPD